MTGTNGSEEWTDVVGTDLAAGRRSDRGRPRWPWVVLGTLFVAAVGSYVAAYTLIGDRVPHGTRVAGVDIGGLSPGAARATLDHDLATRAARPVTFQYAGRAFAVDPSTAGLSFDARQTVVDAGGGGGRSWNPVRMVDVMFGQGSSVDPVRRFDDALLADAVAAVADEVDTTVAEGAIRFHGVRPVIEQPVLGRTVDQAATVEAVRSAYLTTADGVDLPVAEEQPSLTGSELRGFVDSQVDAIVARPIRLVFPGETLALQPRQFAPALSWSVDGGRLVASVDPKILERTAAATLARIEVSPRDASLVLRGGRPVAIPSRPGVTARTAEIAAAVRAVVDDPTRRTVEVGTAVAAPDVTTRDLGDSG